LCAWFERGQRDLPWRRTRDPYAVWISEAMLQQTRVETVIPYWRRFVARFPDVRALASASENDVVAAWSGLGYYRRARALHAAARAIVARHAGACPTTRAQWLELPGVGPYTAGAVLSIAFDQPEPLVDGNVLRVFARLFAIDAELGRASTVARMWQRAAELVPRRRRGAVRPRNWNQALMELGATVCLPREPLCDRCPVRARCAAHAAGRTAELPVVAQRAPAGGGGPASQPGGGPPPAPAVAVALESLLVRDADRVLLQQRPAGGRMARMWELPTRERVAAGAQPRLWPERYAPELALASAAARPFSTLRHSITTHRITADVRAAELALEPRAPLAWLRARELERYALTGLTRKALAPLTTAPALAAVRAIKDARSNPRPASPSAARTPR
jgi:A/G-specific adenine glycosylase